MRIAAKRLLDLQGKTVHAPPHVGPADRKPDPHAGWKRNHRRSSAFSTSRSEAELTQPPTRRRWPFGNSISIALRSVARTAGFGCSGLTTTGTSCGAVAGGAALANRLRHVKTRLAFTSYRRATADTEAPVPLPPPQSPASAPPARIYTVAADANLCPSIR
jgi:hypothetical protein